MTDLTNMSKWVDNPDYLEIIKDIEGLEVEIQEVEQELEEVNAELEKAKTQKSYTKSMKKLLTSYHGSLTADLESMRPYLVSLQERAAYLQFIDANGMVEMESLDKVNIGDVERILVNVIPTLPLRGDLVSEFSGTLEGSPHGVSPFLNIQKYASLIEEAFHPGALDYEYISEVAMEMIAKIVPEKELEERAELVAQGTLKPLMVVPKKVDVNVLVDSYGGSPTEAYNISTKLLRESKKHDIPYNTFTNNGAFSGGMFILATGQKAFVASPFTDAGSIGVVGGYCQLTDYGREKSRVRHHIVTAGDKKRSSIDDVHEETNEEDEAEYKVRLLETHELFKDFVREHRPENSLKGDEVEMFSGISFSAKRSIELGLIDGICHHDEYVEETYGDRVICYEMSVTDPSVNASAMLEKITGAQQVSHSQIEETALQQTCKSMQVFANKSSRFDPILAKK